MRTTSIQYGIRNLPANNAKKPSFGAMRPEEKSIAKIFKQLAAEHKVQRPELQDVANDEQALALTVSDIYGSIKADQLNHYVNTAGEDPFAKGNEQLLKEAVEHHLELDGEREHQKTSSTVFIAGQPTNIWPDDTIEAEEADAEVQNEAEKIKQLMRKMGKTGVPVDLSQLDPIRGPRATGRYN